MYICVCKGITEDQLKSVAGHTTSRREVLKKLGVGENCGTCLLAAMDVLDIHEVPTQSQEESSSSKKDGGPKIPN